MEDARKYWQIQEPGSFGSFIVAAYDNEIGEDEDQMSPDALVEGLSAYMELSGEEIEGIRISGAEVAQRAIARHLHEVPDSVLTPTYKALMRQSGTFNFRSPGAYPYHYTRRLMGTDMWEQNVTILKMLVNQVVETYENPSGIGIPEDDL